MDGSVAEKLRLLQSGDHPEYPLLLGDPKPRLKSDHIPHAPGPILAPELHHGICLAAGPGVGETDGFERPESEHVFPARRHHFDWQAPLEIGRLIELVPVMQVGSLERIEKRQVLVAVQAGS